MAKAEATERAPAIGCYVDIDELPLLDLAWIVERIGPAPTAEACAAIRDLALLLAMVNDEG